MSFNQTNINSAAKVSRKFINKFIKIYRVQQIQDIKPHYANILVLPKVAVMGINVNLPMEIKNCD